MIQQALNQQQLQSVLYQSDNLREQLREKNMTISDMQRQLTQLEKLRENNFTSDEVCCNTQLAKVHIYYCYCCCYCRVICILF